jgi:hypothetical protein
MAQPANDGFDVADARRKPEIPDIAIGSAHAPDVIAHNTPSATGKLIGHYAQMRYAAAIRMNVTENIRREYQWLAASEFDKRNACAIARFYVLNGRKQGWNTWLSGIGSIKPHFQNVSLQCCRVPGRLLH